MGIEVNDVEVHRLLTVLKEADFEVTGVNERRNGVSVTVDIEGVGHE